MYHKTFYSFILVCEFIYVTECKGIIRPLTLPQEKGLPQDRTELPHSSEPRQDSVIFPEIIKAESTHCEPSIYIAPVVNVSTQSMEKKMKALTKQVQLLTEQVRLIAIREERPVLQGTRLFQTGYSQGLSHRVLEIPPRDCSEILERGSHASGEYVIQPMAVGRPFRVYCDMTTEGGGWTVFQRRKSGSENFRRSWPTYRRGFGDVMEEFWLGLENLHQLTVTDEFELRVELQDFEDISVVSTYAWMRVDDVTTNYQLHIGRYSGLGGDALSFHNGQQFSTYDRDHDSVHDDSCSLHHGGAGWWFANCLEANPNGLYLGGFNEMKAQGIVWNAWKGPSYSLKSIEMKLRPCVGD